jgi:hypothetical protein
MTFNLLKALKDTVRLPHLFIQASQADSMRTLSYTCSYWRCWLVVSTERISCQQARLKSDMPWRRKECFRGWRVSSCHSHDKRKIIFQNRWHLIQVFHYPSGRESISQVSLPHSNHSQPPCLTRLAGVSAVLLQLEWSMLLVSSTERRSTERKKHTRIYPDRGCRLPRSILTSLEPSFSQFLGLL